MIFESFSVILRQISLGVHSYAVVHFPCLTKKSFKNRYFWVFAVTLGQMSLGVPTVRRRSFSLSYEKILQKSRFLGLCRNARSNVTRSTDSTPSFIFLVLRKNPSKIEILGLFGDTASNFTRSIFVRRRLFSLSYEKILQKSRLWVFYVIQRQISIGVHSYAVVHFPCLTKKFFKNRDFWVFLLTLRQISLGVPTVRCRSFSLSYEKILQKSSFWDFSLILRQISLGVHSYAVVHFPCLTKKSFKNRDFWVFAVTLGQMSLGVPTVRCRSFSLSYEKILQKSSFWVFSEILRQISLGVQSHAVVHFPTERLSV